MLKPFTTFKPRYGFKNLDGQLKIVKYTHTIRSKLNRNESVGELFAEFMRHIERIERDDDAVSYKIIDAHASKANLTLLDFINSIKKIYLEILHNSPEKLI